MTRLSTMGIVIGLCLLPAARAVHAQETGVEPMLAAAEDFLALVDEGKYGESWDAAAEMFRAAVTRARWAAMAADARSPLGTVSSRSFREANPIPAPAGAPPGEYATVLFDTMFEQKPGAVETVSLVKDGDTWRVVGYFVR